MKTARFFLVTCALAPFALLTAQQDPQKPKNCEEVFSNIKSFKGVPASDLIPAMEFMSASLKYKCTDCHDASDYAKETPKIVTTRNMIDLQREINEKFFNGKLEVTCNSCHNGKDHPAGTPIPNKIEMRHERLAPSPKVEDVLAKHSAAVGSSATAIVRTGTLTSPDLVTHKIKTEPLTFTQEENGKFSMDAGDKKVKNDGTAVTWGDSVLWDEPAHTFNRFGRSYRGANAFAGFERTTVSGKSKIGDVETIVVRGVRPATTSTEELYFDAKSGLLLRMVNMKRSSLGTVITSFDYSNYKKVGNATVPMKVVATFAGDEQWIMDFSSAKN